MSVPSAGGKARGHFIVFEGGEGSGKSTQAALLAAAIGAELTHQPGGTRLGAALRSMLLDSSAGEVAERTEALLMAADRAQHVAELIVPLLSAGRTVVCDRYIGSSVAYQGFGRGLDPSSVEEISRWAVDGLAADLVVLLDIDEELASARTGSPRDRIEAAGPEFHRRVRAGFLAQAEADPRRWVVIDAAVTVTAVHEQVLDSLDQRLGIRIP